MLSSSRVGLCVASSFEILVCVTKPRKVLCVLWRSRTVDGADVWF